MKKVITLFIIFVYFFLFSCCDNAQIDKFSSSEAENIPATETEPAHSITPIPQDACRLIVNGKDITESTYVRIDYNIYAAEIPVLSVFRELGHNAEMKYVEETDSYIALIDQEIILLDTQYQDFGLPTRMQTKYIRRIENNDFIVDSRSLIKKTYWPFNMRIEIDFESGIVYVNSGSTFDGKEYACSLIVNGKDITGNNYIRIQEGDGYTETVIPFLVIVCELGADVFWENESKVSIKYKGKTETYDISDSDFGVFVPEGGVSTRKIVNGDLIFDATSIEGILNQTYNVKIEIDKDNRIVYVNSLK